MYSIIIEYLQGANILKCDEKLYRQWSCGNALRVCYLYEGKEGIVVCILIEYKVGD